MGYCATQLGSVINRTAILAALIFFNTGSHAQNPEEITRAKILVSRSPVELPLFHEIAERPLINFYTNEDDYAKARNDSRYEFERLSYLSDGLEVVALLYRRPDRRGPQPTVVFNRGSYIRNEAAPEYLSTFHRLAESGYTVLAPMYRGSEGAEGHDEMGGDDLNDLLQVAALVDELPSVDAQRLFLLGESRGGMMVLQAIREGFPARAAAIYGGPTDFFSLLSQYPEQYEGVADQLWPNWRIDPEAVLGRRSAVKWADSIDIPLLIMHGGNDQSMPVAQSLALVDRLQEHGKTYELHILGYENHVISGSVIERDGLVTAWYKKHDTN